MRRFGRLVGDGPDAVANPGEAPHAADDNHVRQVTIRLRDVPRGDLERKRGRDDEQVKHIHRVAAKGHAERCHKREEGTAGKMYTPLCLPLQARVHIRGELHFSGE